MTLLHISWIHECGKKSKDKTQDQIENKIVTKNRGHQLEIKNNITSSQVNARHDKESNNENDDEISDHWRLQPVMLATHSSLLDYDNIAPF